MAKTTDDQTRRKRIEFPGKSAFVYPWPREGFLFVFGSPLINVHVESLHCFLSKRPPRYLSAQVIANTSPFVPPPWPSSTGPFPSTTALSPLLSSIFDENFHQRTDFSLLSSRKTLVSNYAGFQRETEEERETDNNNGSVIVVTLGSAIRSRLLFFWCSKR